MTTQLTTPRQPAHLRAALVRVAVIILLLAGAAWMSWQFWRLLRQPDPMGAVDLRLRYIEVHHWFAGIPAYGEHEEVPSAYPPASFAILWPLLGWLSFSAGRWLWAITSVCAMLATMFALIQCSGASSRIERVLIGALIVGTYPAGATIGNGQLAIHVLACALWTVLWLLRHPTGIRRYIAVPMIVFSMVKPSSALPFLVLALFLPGGVLPILVSAVLYLGLTFLAATFQPADLLSLLRGMAAESSHLATFTGSLHYANLHAWLSEIGVRSLLLPASVAALLIFAAWLFLHRKCDIWLLLGITSIVTRMLTYHRWYDDVLLLIPMAVLFRLATGHSSRFAAILFWIGVATMLAPGGLYTLPGRLPWVYTAWETVLWLTYLLFLAQTCARENQRSPAYVRIRFFGKQ